MKTKIQLDPGATIPTRAHTTDVGYDVTSLTLSIVHKNGSITTCTTEEQIAEILHSYNTTPNYFIVDTGIHLTPPTGYYFELVPNSRQAKTTAAWHNSIGIIDPTYTGSIKIIIKLATSKDLAKYLPGNVVGQLILRPHLSTTFEQVPTLEQTERGTGGFGSTERKEQK